MSGRGKLASFQPIPERFEVKYTIRNKAGRRYLSFQRGAVSEQTPPRVRGGGRVPVTAAHLQNVLDPLTAMFAAFPTQTGRHPCRQDLAVYDGKLRFDILLSPKREEKISYPAFEPQAFVCKIKFKPIAGHRGDNTIMAKIAAQDDIEVWIARPQGADFFLPTRASGLTPIGQGTAEIKAFKFLPAS